MIFRKGRTYPSPWRLRFALWPVLISDDGQYRHYLWLRFFEARRVTRYDVERRPPGDEHTAPFKVEPWWA